MCMRLFSILFEIFLITSFLLCLYLLVIIHTQHTDGTATSEKVIKDTTECQVHE